MNYDDFSPDLSVTVCKQCLVMTKMFYDRSSGDIVCTGCGLVAENNIAVPLEEYHGMDSGRVGFSTTMTIRTYISDNGDNARRLQRAQQRTFSSPEDRRETALASDMYVIDDICGRLNVDTATKRSQEIWTDYRTKMRVMPHSVDTKVPVLISCIYAALLELKVPRSAFELATPLNIPVGKVLDAIQSYLEITDAVVVSSNPEPHDFIRRFVSDICPGMERVLFMSVIRDAEGVAAQIKDKYLMQSKDPEKVARSIVVNVLETRGIETVSRKLDRGVMFLKAYGVCVSTYVEIVKTVKSM